MRSATIPGASAAALVGAILVGCGISDLDGQDAAIVFAGSFQPVEVVEMIEGNVHALSRNGQTEVYFGIGGLASVSVYSWTIRRHACSEAGEQLLEVATFPSFQTNGAGEGSHGLLLQGMLDVAEEYAVEVFDGENGSGMIVACGTLTAT